MRRLTRFRFAALAASCLLSLAGCGRDSHPSPDDASTTVTLFVAASLTDVIQEIGDLYSQTHPVTLVYNFAGSGALAQQLIAAPRADLFISASERWMDAVAKAGRIEPGTRIDLLANRLVVIANANSPDAQPLANPADLARRPFAFLAIGDPASVPAGRYAKQWLQTFSLPDGGSLWDAVQPRLSPAPDVRAALTQVVGRRDVAGIVYRTDFQARREQLRLLYEVPSDEGPSIVYPAALLADAQSKEPARALLAFLRGPQARAIFVKRGFDVVAQP